LQYKAGEQMSLIHTVESNKSSTPWLPVIPGIGRAEKFLSKFYFKMHGPIPTPTATYIVMSWTKTALLLIELHGNKRCP